MTELLPCPFCGGDKPYVYGPTCSKNTPYNPADRAAPWVVCGQCHAVIHGMDWDESKESAIANWNRRAHLSQPQPVAQGEAVGLQPHKWERKYTGTGRTVWECSECFRYGGFAERPCSEPSKHPGCNADALQATPTIPTGHRVVADGLAKDAARYQWLRDRVCVRWEMALDGEKHEALGMRPGFGFLRSTMDPAKGWTLPEFFDDHRQKTDNAIDKAMLAAAPDAGGV